MADERRGAYVVAKIRQIEYELGIITGLSRGFEQRRARADGADAPVRVDFELRNEGKLPENWGSARGTGEVLRNAKDKSSIISMGVRQRSFGWPAPEHLTH